MWWKTHSALPAHTHFRHTPALKPWTHEARKPLQYSCGPLLSISKAVWICFCHDVTTGVVLNKHACKTTAPTPGANLPPPTLSWVCFGFAEARCQRLEPDTPTAKQNLCQYLVSAAENQRTQWLLFIPNVSATVRHISLITTLNTQSYTQKERNQD